MFDEPRFHDEDEARKHLESIRWPNGCKVCPHCGASGRIFPIESKSKGNGKRKGARPGLLFCGDCREQFTVTVGTVFEHSKIPLHKWVLGYTPALLKQKRHIRPPVEPHLGRDL